MRSILCVAAILAFLVGLGAPLDAAPTICETTWTDPARSRDVPVRIRMPEGSGPVPVILFSHGLGGSLDSGTAWAEAWSQAGFAVVNLQHPGSDRAILGSGRGALLRAMAPRQRAERSRDVGFVIDSLARARRMDRCDLGRIDTSRVGMSGHSYGAHTTQAVSGQIFPGRTLRDLTEPRVRAAIAFSPSPPFRGPAAAAFRGISIPFFSITGSEDTVPFLPQISAADRERPFRAMPPGGKYLLVIAGADHMAFNAGGERRAGRRDTDPRIVALVAAATTDFWRWTLGGDEGARRRLDSLEARLAPGDRFERK